MTFPFSLHAIDPNLSPLETLICGGVSARSRLQQRWAIYTSLWVSEAVVFIVTYPIPFHSSGIWMPCSQQDRLLASFVQRINAWHQLMTYGNLPLKISTQQAGKRRKLLSTACLSFPLLNQNHVAYLVGIIIIIALCYNYRT